MTIMQKILRKYRSKYGHVLYYSTTTYFFLRDRNNLLPHAGRRDIAHPKSRPERVVASAPQRYQCLLARGDVTHSPYSRAFRIRTKELPGSGNGRIVG